MKTYIAKLSWILAVSGIVAFLISTPLLAKQDCTELVWEGDYKILTIEDLEALSGYTSVTGNLGIGNTDLTSLDGLECLTAVGENLAIYYNNYLTNLDGLKNLKYVDRDFIISNNDSLKNLDGLVNLTSVYYYLSIRDNVSLTSTEGLKKTNIRREPTNNWKRFPNNHKRSQQPIRG